MGQWWCRPYLLGEAVVGAYSYNQCHCCKVKCGCNQCTQWRTRGCDGMRFSDPAWQKGTPLRTQFDDYLESQGMQDVLETAPKRCACCPGGGFRSVITMAPTLNMQWCPQVNEALLHPAGYHVDAFFWITYDNKGNPYEHMVLRVQRLQEVVVTTDVPVATAVAVGGPKSEALPTHGATPSGASPLQQPMIR